MFGQHAIAICLSQIRPVLNISFFIRMAFTVLYLFRCKTCIEFIAVSLQGSMLLAICLGKRTSTVVISDAISIGVAFLDLLEHYPQCCFIKGSMLLLNA